MKIKSQTTGAVVPNMEPYLQMPGRVCQLDGTVYVQRVTHTPLIWQLQAVAMYL